MSPNNSTLISVLARAQTVGFLGPGDIETHIDHAARFAAGLTEENTNLADIGSGGGVPALPLLLANEQLNATLVDTSQRRCSFLVWAVCELELQERVDVKRSRAEELARDDDFRGSFSAVTARGFGPPSWTFECAIGLLEVGGRFVVSEPPDERRWPDESTLLSFGMAQVEPTDGIAVFERVSAIPDRLPRRPKTASKKPLF